MAVPRPKIGLVYKSLGLTPETWDAIKRKEKNANQFIRNLVEKELGQTKKKPKKSKKA